MTVHTDVLAAATRYAAAVQAMTSFVASTLQEDDEHWSTTRAIFCQAVAGEVARFTDQQGDVVLALRLAHLALTFGFCVGTGAVVKGTAVHNSIDLEACLLHQSLATSWLAQHDDHLRGIAQVCWLAPTRDVPQDSAWAVLLLGIAYGYQCGRQHYTAGNDEARAVRRRNRLTQRT